MICSPGTLGKMLFICITKNSVLPAELSVQANKAKDSCYSLFCNGEQRCCMTGKLTCPR